MKKITAIILVLVLSLSFALTGCSKGKDIISDDGVAVPGGMQRISPSTVDYYLFVSEDWKADISTGVVTAYRSDTDPTNICMMSFGLKDMTMTYSEYWDSYENQFKAIYDNFEMVEESETLLGESSAGKYVYTATFFGGSSEKEADETTAADTIADEGNAEDGASDGVDYKFMTVVTVKNGSVYILTYTSLASSYDNNISDFTEVIRNFRFKD